MSLSGKSVCFSGTLSVTRAVATAAAIGAGAAISKTVTNSTDILVVSQISTSKKISDAQAKGVEVWDEDDFNKAVAGKGKKRKAAAKKAAPAAKKAKAVASKSVKATKAAPAKAAKKGKGKLKAGLKGQALPNSTDNSMLELDSGVASINQEVADEGIIDEDDNADAYAANLALVDPSINSDKYYILQLIDCNGDKYVYRRNGRTGSAGQAQLDGPLDEDKAIKKFCDLFKSKSGQTWESRVAGNKPANKKHYTYLKTNWAARNEESEAIWKYQLVNDPLGKPDGWYDYDKENSEEVEDLYISYAVDGNESMAVRYIHSESSGYTYKVDLDKYTQTNTTSGKCRPIRRDELEE